MSLVARLWGKRIKSIGFVVTAGAVAGISVPYHNVHRQVFAAQLVECPHDFTPFLDSTVVPGELTLPGRITNVPEFHDCQRFIVTKGEGFGYLPVFAIFGAWDLPARWDSVVAHPDTSHAEARITYPIDSMSADLATTADFNRVRSPAPSPPSANPALSPNSRSGWGFVEILAEGKYVPLGIGPGFNCVYLFMTQSGLQARMVQFGGREPDCALPVDPDTLAGTDLQVRRPRNRWHQRAEDFPSAARWDWDPEHKIQYFGVKCGAGWCEVGPPGFLASTIPILPSVPDEAASYWHRVRHIKGWFDQQRLAPAQGKDPLSPEAGWGEVFADPLLQKAVVATFSDRWVLVARARMDASLPDYATKWNLGPAGAQNKENLLYFCHAVWSVCYGKARNVRAFAHGYNPADTRTPECGDDRDYDGVLEPDKGTWWVGIVSTSGGVRFGCVIRRDHAKDFAAYGLSPNGTARWRWRDDDETIWASCAEGCCQVQKPRT